MQNLTIFELKTIFGGNNALESEKISGSDNTHDLDVCLQHADQNEYHKCCKKLYDQKKQELEVERKTTNKIKEIYESIFKNIYDLGRIYADHV